MEELDFSIGRKNQFINMLIHDIKSPLNYLKTRIQLIRLNGTTVKNEDFKFFNNIEKDIEAINHLLNDMINWAPKFEKGQMNYLTFNLYELINSNLQIFDSIIEEKQLRINLNISKEQTVESDADIISFIIRNLLSNSVKYTDQGGEIHIYHRKQENSSEIIIEDNGVGMNKDVIRKLDENQRAAKTNKEGSGFGLLFSKEILHKIEGKLCIESQEGVGTTFVLTIKTKPVAVG